MSILFYVLNKKNDSKKNVIVVILNTHFLQN